MNIVATIALVTFPILALVLYSTKPVSQATILTFVCGHLLLPVGAVIKFEMIPPFDKNSIASFAALMGCLLSARRPSVGPQKFGLVEILIVAFLIGPFITAELNTDPVFVGGTLLPASDLYEALSSVENAFIFLIPFFLGRYFLRDASDIETILRTLVVAWLIYSLPILFEWRMSPQLHTWFYGYSQGLNTEVRGGGMRPRVFVGNGLLLTFYEMTAVVAAAALWKARIRVLNLSSTGVTAYLFVVLSICRSLGSLIYGIILVPLVRFTKPQFQVRFAAALVILALLYPTFRTAKLFPTQTLIEFANRISPERSRSLAYRFIQEDQLLQHESERFFFGWGRFGRSRVLGEDGVDHSVTDGAWIVTMGQFGFVGFLAQFGLIAMGVFRTVLAFKLVNSERHRVLLAAMALIVAINLVESLPNAPITPWTLLLAGALLGRTEAIRVAPRQKNKINSRVKLQQFERGIS